MPSGRQKALTCHLWDVPEHPQIHGMAMGGVRGLSCSHWTSEKPFPQQQNTDRRIWPRSTTSQAISRIPPALHQGTATPCIPSVTGHFQWLQKEFSQKMCYYLDETFLVCMYHCACHQTAAVFHLGKKQPLKQLKLYDSKGRHNNKIQ